MTSPLQWWWTPPGSPPTGHLLLSTSWGGFKAQFGCFLLSETYLGHHIWKLSFSGGSLKSCPPFNSHLAGYLSYSTYQCLHLPTLQGNRQLQVTCLVTSAVREEPGLLVTVGVTEAALHDSWSWILLMIFH